MNQDIKLFDEGLEEYPWSVVILENLALLAWICVGTLLTWNLNHTFGIVYFTFSVVMIVFVMRKLLCTRCYYYGKRCHVGWGKISSTFFKQGNIVDFSTCTGSKIPPVLFGSLALVPILTGIILIFKNPALITCILLLFLVLFVVYSSVISRKKSCSLCKMKLICPGSAVK